MVKAVGLLLIFLVCTAIGHIKATAVLKRKRALTTVCKCLSEMKTRLRCEGSERIRLINEAFSDSGLLDVSNEEIAILPCGFFECDSILLSEFLDSFGSGDLSSEIDRIELYQSVFEQKRQEADNISAQQVKLYRTIGICTGAVICLIFI